MRFHLSPEQVAIQDAVRGTLADLWSLDRMHAFAEGEADTDDESWQALMALGLGGILLPDSGMGLLDAALVCEVVGEAAGAADRAIAGSGRCGALCQSASCGAAR